MLISRARLLPGFSQDGAGPVDVRVEDGVITSLVATSGPGGDIDADGALLLPGLWDAHTHFSTHALITECLDLSPTATAEETVEAVRAHVRNTPGEEPVVGFGFRSGSWLVPPTAVMLDEVAPFPIALIARDMHSAWLNTAALETAGVTGPSTGFLLEDDAFSAISNLMRSLASLLDDAVARAAKAAAVRGLVGIVDMEMQWAIGAWARRAAAGPLTLHVEAATYRQDFERLVAEGLRTGDRLGERLSVGPLKVIFDGSMSTKTAFCAEPYSNPLPDLSHGRTNFTPDELRELLASARAHGVSAAVHAIGDEAARLVLDAFEATGAIGSVEHAQLVSPTDVVRFAPLGVAASVQPSHLIDDQHLVGRIWPHAGSNLYPLRAMLDAGAELRFGSDAPAAPLDPWLSLESAVNRTHHPDQAITPREALAASTRSRVAVGEPADLVLVPLSPEELLAGRFEMPGALATLVAGEATHLAP
ncbi:amidohydrolase family protein [Tessaracoccus terricola]